MLELGSEETLFTREMSSLWRSDPKERLKEGDLEREMGEAHWAKPVYKRVHSYTVVSW